jgi:protein-glucosylgalactosylhydroxylysine glucosidase
MNKSLSFLAALVIPCLCSCDSESPIDRYELVSRHNIENSVFDSLSSLSVGNGEFAYTVDFTGLQTFPEFYSRGISLGTMSNWGWHSDKNPENFSLSDVYKKYNVNGRDVEYVNQFRNGEEERKVIASDWLRGNPHRIHLGMIGLDLKSDSGKAVERSDIKEPVQKLDLWRGEIDSRFSVDGDPVHVRTVCHPDLDQISVRIVSPLIEKKKLRIKINFPRGIAAWSGYDFSFPEKNITQLVSDSGDIIVFRRVQDNDEYYLRVLKNKADLIKGEDQTWYLAPSQTDSIYSFSCHFTQAEDAGRPSEFDETSASSSLNWKNFWTTGGAVDFSECTDPRATELERRVILSRYLTKIQCSGSLPPQETGLTYNSWFGKFHLEMHWWHGVHFALWQKAEILEKQMGYYSAIFEQAEKTAQHQGYKGVRWPKMVGPDGRESPSTVGTYLIWQQPHPIFYAELLYLNATDKSEILEKYKEIVFATADFMSSYAWYDKTGDRYTLGPVLIPAQESLNKETTINPAFELVYWYWGLRTAAEWRKRLNLEPESAWDLVVEKISALPVQDGIYLCSEDTRDSYLNPRYMSDHPIVSGVSGFLPQTRLVDNTILGNTLDTIMKKWNWKTTWGWDFPMLAMSAASIGRGEQAVDFLMMDAPKNTYLMNGHNYQDARLSIYLPGNGGLLTAVAKMCVEDQFPKNGKWKVKWENLNKYVE